jgi:hypothetical protein
MLVMTMVIVTMENVIARMDSQDHYVNSILVQVDVLDMDRVVLENALARNYGKEMIVVKLFVHWIVIKMEFVQMKENVSVILVGKELTVGLNNALEIVMVGVNANQLTLILSNVIVLLVILE